jgi:hypothetical protein
MVVMTEKRLRHSIYFCGSSYGITARVPCQNRVKTRSRNHEPCQNSKAAISISYGHWRKDAELVRAGVDRGTKSEASIVPL